MGGLLYGVLGDRLGRKEATWWAIFGMSIATVAQGCLPSKCAPPRPTSILLCKTPPAFAASLSYGFVVFSCTGDDLGALSASVIIDVQLWLKDSLERTRRRLPCEPP